MLGLWRMALEGLSQLFTLNEWKTLPGNFVMCVMTFWQFTN